MRVKYDASVSRVRFFTEMERVEYATVLPENLRLSNRQVVTGR